MTLRTLTAAMLFSYSFHVHSSDLDEPGCTRPQPGTYAGACAARESDDYARKFQFDLYYSSRSQFGFYEWIGCLEEKNHVPSGGYSDAVFYTELIPEWEKEIDANLLALQSLLSKRGRASLQREQQQWILARERHFQRRGKQPQGEGTLNMARNSAHALDFVEKRAVELACRVEKFSRKP